MSNVRFENTIKDIDAINADDPHKEMVNGEEMPRELTYSYRMTEVLRDFCPNAPETLQLAARAQHIKRWSSPRENYPMDRKGYLMWRSQLKIFHADLVGAIMKKEGYNDEDIQRVGDLVQKKRLKTDEDVQTLEDVICLVFLKYYFDDFIQKHEEVKLIEIIQKTWRKMSERGHKAALAMPHSEQARIIVEKALA